MRPTALGVTHAFLVAAVCAFVEPGALAQPSQSAVVHHDLVVTLDPANHRLDEREWQGHRRRFYAMPHEGRYIWGATAGILRNLYEKLFT